MSLKERIPGDLKDALRNKRTLELNVLRMLQSAIRNQDIDNKGELNDDQVIQVISSEIKKRKDSVEEYKKVGREDAAETEEKEIEILMNYMPEQLSEEDIEASVQNAIQQSGAKSSKDLGQVMKIVMPELKGKADGKLINRIVREKLGELD